MTTGVDEEDSGLDCSADVGSAMAKEEIRSVPVRGRLVSGATSRLSVTSKEEMMYVPVRGRVVGEGLEGECSSGSTDIGWLTTNEEMTSVPVRGSKAVGDAIPLPCTGGTVWGLSAQ